MHTTTRPRINVLDPVSVIMPVRNEERHLETSVQGVLDQAYPGELEILLSVGPSHDRTIQIAERLAADNPHIRVIHNPSGTTPDALNLAIAASRFPVIVRVDAHGELTPGYIETAVELLHATDAANVGGRMDAQGSTSFEKAVALAYNSRLGLGGGGFHLAETPQGPAETVFLGSFRRDALIAVGGYDPDLLRAQDWELNMRLRQAGEKVIYSPKLSVTYRPRSTVRALARQFFATGRWRREVIRRHPETASLRYLAPPLAVSGIGVGIGLAVAPRVPTWLRVVGLMAPLGYAAVVGIGSQVRLEGAEGQHVDAPTRAWLPVVLAVMHMCWGAGFLRGLAPHERHRTDAAPRPS
ncbi:glycosyltransferase family 2 protein [Propionibacteriaceae bacterium G1746]|uniref:glycosyltransferase family 2 protein n=1 Tax=Aestuariimicrobium sp. G57 TaxID=3418485 RepID=UPI003C266475